MPKKNQISSDGSTSLEKLPLNRRIYAEHRIAGQSIKASSKAAGISRRHGQNLEKAADVQAAYRDELRKIMPLRTMANLVKGGANATMPQYGPDGRKKRDRPDWRTRRGYIQMAREDAGYVEKSADSSGIIFNINVENVGSGRTKPIITIPAETD